MCQAGLPVMRTSVRVAESLDDTGYPVDVTRAVGVAWQVELDVRVAARDLAGRPGHEPAPSSRRACEARALIHSEVVDLAGGAGGAVGEDEAVLARLQRLLGSQTVVAARVLLGGLQVHPVLAAHAVLDGAAAVRRVRAARDLEVPVVVVATRLEPHQRRVVRGPRAVEGRLLVRDPIRSFPAPEDQLTLGVEEPGAELDGTGGDDEVHGLAAGEISDALPGAARAGGSGSGRCRLRRSSRGT